MASEFKLPDLGEGVHEGQIIRIHVAEGEQVREDQPLLEVETDKAAVEIPSPHTGVVTCVHVKEDQLVHVGDVMVTFDGGSESSNGASSPAAAATPTRDDAAAPSIETTRSGAPPRRKPASPFVRKLARKLGVDLQMVDGSGPGGRVTRVDVEQAASSPAAPATTTAVAAVATPVRRDSDDIAASNRDSNVGGGGTRSLAPPPAAPSTFGAPATLPGTAGADQWGATSRLPLTRPRMTIAQTMNQSWSTIPHVTDCDDADVSDLDVMRKQFNDAHAAQYGKISMLPFVVRAVAAALRQHPVFNATFDEEQGEIVYRDYINIAIGVQTERGLIAPVIRHADRLGVLHLNAEIMRITEMARTASFEVNDLRGGTFTISNAGAMGGSRYATPLITPGQVAVIAVGRSRKMPWVVDDQVVPRLIMPLSLSFDHRIIDGAEEIAFQQTIIRSLQNPVHLM